MTALRDILMRTIRASGPMSLELFMAEALMHPDHGYYSTRDPFGTAGDFTTSPEISQMFGELIGLSLAQAWIDQGQPTPFTLAELGPGRGTMMADILRATAKVPGFHDAANVHFLETSPVLKNAQFSRIQEELSTRIQGALPSQIDMTWHDDILTMPHQPMFLVANEFFDAMPIRQFKRDGDGWREVLVDIKDDGLATTLGSRLQLPVLDHRLGETVSGDIVELCPALARFTETISNRIANHGGVALIIDYGDWGSLGDTLQAVQNHEPVDPFAQPGEADITAHVDFEVIANAARPAKFTRLSTQGTFLERLGITQRAQTLAEHLSGDALDSHIAAHRRLTHPAEMGSLFKVLGLYPDGAPPPAGLEP